MGSLRRHIKVLIPLVLTALIATLPGLSKNEAPRVLALLTSNAVPYREHLEGFEARFDGEVTSTVMDGDSSRVTARLAADPYSLIFAVGSSAAEFAAAHADGGPVLFSMVYYPERHGLTGRKNVAGISLRVPPQKVLEALDAIKPRDLEKVRVGMVYPAGEDTPELQSIKAALAERGYGLVLRRPGSADELGEAYNGLLSEIDVLWLAPDPAVIPGPEFLKSVLEKALDRKVAVIGASDAHVRGGALLAVSVDYRLEGEEAARLAGRILAGEDLSSIGVVPPKGLVWSLNTKVAEELGWPVLRSARQRFERVYP